LVSKRSTIDSGQLTSFHTFEYDFKRGELATHHVTFDEAVECFFSITK